MNFVLVLTRTFLGRTKLAPRTNALFRTCVSLCCCRICGAVFGFHPRTCAIHPRNAERCWICQTFLYATETVRRKQPQAKDGQYDVRFVDTVANVHQRPQQILDSDDEPLSDNESDEGARSAAAAASLSECANANAHRRRCYLRPVVNEQLPAQPAATASTQAQAQRHAHRKRSWPSISRRRLTHGGLHPHRLRGRCRSRRRSQEPSNLRSSSHHSCRSHLRHRRLRRDPWVHVRYTELEGSSSDRNPAPLHHECADARVGR